MESSNGSRTIKVYYMNHVDSMTRLKPLLLFDGGLIWNGAIKYRIGRNPMYYIFFHTHSFIKLWKDNHGNLLYYIDNYKPGFFFAEEPEMWMMDPLLKWDEDTLTYNENKLTFSIPIFKITGQIDMWLPNPIAYIVSKLFINSSASQVSEQNSIQE